MEGQGGFMTKHTMHDFLPSSLLALYQQTSP